MVCEIRRNRGVIYSLLLARLLTHSLQIASTRCRRAGSAVAPYSSGVFVSGVRTYMNIPSSKYHCSSYLLAMNGSKGVCASNKAKFHAHEDNAKASATHTGTCFIWKGKVRPASSLGCIQLNSFIQRRRSYLLNSLSTHCQGVSTFLSCLVPRARNLICQLRNTQNTKDFHHHKSFAI